jgi:Na+/H+-dicarboxylate symporter
MKQTKPGLLFKVFIAIITGVLCGYFFPEWATRIFATFNGLFSQFLGFCIPLIILGLVAPGIADLGKKAGKLLLVTVALAYTSTLFSGFFTYFSCEAFFPKILAGTQLDMDVKNPETMLLAPYFKIDMPPVFDVMTALVLAFVIGIGLTAVKGDTLKSALMEFRKIIELLISRAIIPLLPLYIFGIFINISHSGAAIHLASVFGKVVIVIIILHILLLLIMFSVAGATAKRNPLKMLRTMLPAYMTALGTSSSAATIPVTLRQAKKLDVEEEIADFCVPLCATIHLSGSAMKIVSISLAICIVTGLPHDLTLSSKFILMIGVLMIAAPGVPGGAIMAAVGALQTILGLNETSIGLMIALYIALDSFGTACNVTGDGALTVIVNKIHRQNTEKQKHIETQD